MGNSGSSTRDQQAAPICSNGSIIEETSRGWSQSFPRELPRHRSQPSAGRKVLPEPPVQRLRATDNGSIIHNGGTISGRRAPAFASSCDLVKYNELSFRERSSSGSNLVGHRPPRRFDRHCCRYYRVDSNRPDTLTDSGNLKRFGSEPDLRCSPDGARTSMHDRVSPVGHSIDREEAGPTTNCCRYVKESKERLESKYKVRKKYKAPAPPAIAGTDLTDGSVLAGTSLSISNPSNDQLLRRQHQKLEPPPRRSRLFKTRVESKKAQVSWQLSAPIDPVRQIDGSRANQHTGSKDIANWQGRDRVQCLNVDDTRRSRRSKMSANGKNTLQRSMSSPEFQAELIQVARRVRDKLGLGGRNNNQTMQFDERDEIINRQAVENAQEYGRNSNEGRALDTVKGGKINCANDVDKRDSNGETRRNIVSSERQQRIDNEKSKSGMLYPSSGNSFPRDKLADLSRERTDSGIDERRHRSVGNKENLDPGLRRDRSSAIVCKQLVARKVETADNKLESRSKCNNDIGEIKHHELEKHGDNEQSEQKFDSAAQSAPRTFYFGMNETPMAECCKNEEPDAGRGYEGKSKFQDRENPRPAADTSDETDDNDNNVVENISLNIRPTLPKKQLEIPRFSPSAAWRLLSALEAPGPSMSTASEEMPLMFEERIERLSRPPPPFPLSLGSRSWHDKSGDSGISGDAEAANDDSLDVSTANRVKTTAIRPTWTPQQDLGEESSSDAGVDSPPPLATSLNYRPPRPHVFSLSLPRDDARGHLCNQDVKSKEGSAFNSLQKLKRSVSGAFGIGTHDHQRRMCTRDILDDNWFLSSSAPTSLQLHQPCVEPTSILPSGWTTNATNVPSKRSTRRDRTSDDEEDVDENNVDDVDDDLPGDVDDGNDDKRFQVPRDVQGKRNNFPVILKPPSFSYLTPAGHVMYLPETNASEHRKQNFTRRNVVGAHSYDHEGQTRREKNGKSSEYLSNVTPIRLNGHSHNEEEEEDEEERERYEEYEHEEQGVIKYEDEPSVESRQRNTSKSSMIANDSKELCNGVVDSPDRINKRNLDQSPSLGMKDSKPSRKSTSKGKRFTFQSTVRQIERRRLAEKLSREVEAKERQRKGELEAMRKVEEEFQRKRAKEKANIRQQLRLFKEMEDNLNKSLPSDWDGSQLSRADPDGAPSSTASSPTSLPVGNLSTTTTGKVSSDDFEFRRKKNGTDIDSKDRRGDSKHYRPKYFDWSPDSTSHGDSKQTTVHPKVVCDIPKSSPVFVDANLHPGKPTGANSTPRSDNYRKDFAHGTVATKTSFASSDSEVSQPNTRPQSRENGNKNKTHRSRSDTPRVQEGAVCLQEDSTSMEPITQPAKIPANDFILSGVQPFTKEKAYRPITFNPRPSLPISS